jgi:hypothetical protein
LAWASRADSGLLSAYANDVGARAYAALTGRSHSSANNREQVACRNALDNTQENLSSASPDDPGAPLLYFYNRGQFLVREAECLLDLGTVQEASDAATLALSSLPPEFNRNIAFCKLTLARAHAKEHDLAQASHELRNAAELATQNMSLRLRRSISVTRAILPPSKAPELAELDEFLGEHQFELPSG